MANFTQVTSAPSFTGSIGESNDRLSSNFGGGAENDDFREQLFAQLGTSKRFMPGEVLIEVRCASPITRRSTRLRLPAR